MYTMANTANRSTRENVSAGTSSTAHGGAVRRSAVDPLDRLGASATFDKRRTIYYEGDEAQHYYKVVSGVVRLCKVTEDGRRQIAAFLVSGDFFGWTVQDDYSYSAEAVTDATVVRYSRRRVEEAVRTDTAVGRRVLGLLTNQLASAHDHLLLLGRMTATERLSAFLLDLNRRNGGADEGAATIELPMNRRDIADYLGLTIETVSRTMSAMKRKGLVSFTGADSVRLNRCEALERMAMAA
ncbi:MAG TPA: helix-turn-helix domain-containing protein [Alphaproteobacteria bacterium]|jgi:CRP-like cAMP-binding protein|nr:helix-turn-helix domain-containing protein [Alphaproteobacteria bacterium]